MITDRLLNNDILSHYVINQLMMCVIKMYYGCIMST